MGGGGVEEKVEKELSPSWNRLGSGNVQFLGFLHVPLHARVSV